MDTNKLCWSTLHNCDKRLSRNDFLNKTVLSWLSHKWKHRTAGSRKPLKHLSSPKLCISGTSVQGGQTEAMEFHLGSYTSTTNYIFIYFTQREKRKKCQSWNWGGGELSNLFTTHVSFCLHSILHYLILPSWSHWWILYPTHTATYIHTRVHYRLVSTHGGEQESLFWVWVTLLNIILSTSIYFPANFKMSFLFTAD